jgi:ATP-dependent Clp protease ATP-binding subunit ClpB
VDFKNTVIVMTSNIAGDKIMSLANDDGGEHFIEAAVKDELKRFFRPEFLNRVDETIVFRPLGKGQLTKIVDVQLRHLAKRLAGRGVGLHVTDAAKALLAEEGYDVQFGARPLKRVIQQRIENPLAARLLKGEFADGDVVQVDADAHNPEAKTFVFRKGSQVLRGELVGA